MKFEKQVENAKTEKLKYRITRDVLFIVLGILFLIISIILAYSDSDKKIKTLITIIIIMKLRKQNNCFLFFA